MSDAKYTLGKKLFDLYVPTALDTEIFCLMTSDDAEDRRLGQELIDERDESEQEEAQPEEKTE